MSRKLKQDHLTSLRLPKKWNKWIKQFADQCAATPAYIYRSAIREFILNKGGKL